MVRARSSRLIRAAGGRADERLERLQPIRPEALVELEPGAGVGKRTRIDPAYPLPSPRLARHQACAFEHAEMFGHCGQREIERPGEMADVRLPRSQTIEERAAGRIPERMNTRSRFCSTMWLNIHAVGHHSTRWQSVFDLPTGSASCAFPVWASCSPRRHTQPSRLPNPFRVDVFHRGADASAPRHGNKPRVATAQLTAVALPHAFLSTQTTLPTMCTSCAETA